MGSVFLYNTEIWTTNKTIEGALDSFHRRMLRKAVNIVYPRKISNIDLYKVTKATPWSEIIRERRMKWLGQLLCLLEETPPRKAFIIFKEPTNKPRGAEKTTWVKNAEKDLNRLGTNLESAKITAVDRPMWRRVVVKGVRENSQSTQSTEEQTR